MTDHPPERRRMPGQFVTMDAAMLAAQNERLDQLNENIQALAKSISERPTAEDLLRARRRGRNQLIATILVFAILLSGIGYALVRLHAQCEDRNANAAAFRTLLVVLIDEGQAQSPREDTVVEKALKEYLDTIKPIDC